MDEDRRTDADERGDALTPGSRPAADEEGGAETRFDPLPKSLRQRLDVCATDWLRDGGGLPSSRSRLGWYVATACFALAVVGWWPRLASSPPFDGSTAVGRLSAELSRDHMISTGGVALRHWSWSASASAPGLKGDVVWDGSQQRGYLLFDGLEPNVPARHQYQLWIVDAARDARYPVDGGVFDVASPGPVVVPVKAAVPVHEPVAFVVTIEKPGGTVVSARERVVAIAQADGL